MSCDIKYLTTWHCGYNLTRPELQHYDNNLIFSSYTTTIFISIIITKIYKSSWCVQLANCTKLIALSILNIVIKAHWRDLKFIKQSSPIPMVQSPIQLIALILTAGPAGPSLSSLQPVPDPYCPVSSGPGTHLVTVNKLVQASYTDTGPLKYMVHTKEEETSFCSTHQINTYNKHCLLSPTTIHKVHTTGCVKTQQTEESTISVNGFKYGDTTSVADQKGNLLLWQWKYESKNRSKSCSQAFSYTCI